MDLKLGNSSSNFRKQSCYNANTLRLEALRAYTGSLLACSTNPSSPILNLKFTSQPNGNISQVMDVRQGETINYGYDALDRLTSASSPVSETYTYSVDNNLLSRNSTNYTYASSQAHAVSSLSTGESYGYDANGNMTQRVEGGSTYSQVFDAGNRLISVTVNGQTTQFFYDGNGILVKKVMPDGSRTIYIGGIYEVNKNSSGTVTGTILYYPAAGAMRVNGTVYYTLGDQLGSTSVVTNASGTVVGTQVYYPFGRTRYSTGTLYTDRLYTGQQEISGLGLYNYKARFYDPTLGRFISPDSITPGGPEGLNMYAYVNNSPINFVDPSGHMATECSDGTGGCGGGILTGLLPPEESDSQQLPTDPIEVAMDGEDPGKLTTAEKIGFGVAVIVLDVALTAAELTLLALGIGLVDTGGMGVIVDLAIILPIELLLIDIEIGVTMYAADIITSGTKTGHKPEFHIIIPFLKKLQTKN